MAGSSDKELQLRENQDLIAARQRRGESLAQWAARLTKLGDEAGRTQLRDKLLRDKFVTGLIQSPIKMMIQMKTDLHNYTFKQVLDFAFTTAAEIDLYDKKMQAMEERKKRFLEMTQDKEFVREAATAAEAKRAEAQWAEEQLDAEVKEYFGDSD